MRSALNPPPSSGSRDVVLERERLLEHPAQLVDLAAQLLGAVRVLVSCVSVRRCDFETFSVCSSSVASTGTSRSSDLTRDAGRRPPSAPRERRHELEDLTGVARGVG